MNSVQQTFEQFLTTGSTEVSLLGFVINLLLAAALAFLLHGLYVRFGRSLSNRRRFGANFLAITMTTMFIITVVKSSLALSLGLVGALSIVRFRAAIKEPEELAYLFLAIAVGLGLGADQRLLTLVAFFFIALFIVLRSHRDRTEESENLHLRVTSEGSGEVDLEAVVDALRPHCSTLKIKRLDEDSEGMDVSFLVEFSSFADLRACKTSLRDLDGALRVSFLDQRGLD